VQERETQATTTPIELKCFLDHQARARYSAQSRSTNERSVYRNNHEQRKKVDTTTRCHSSASAQPRQSQRSLPTWSPSRRWLCPLEFALTMGFDLDLDLLLLGSTVTRPLMDDSGVFTGADVALDWLTRRTPTGSCREGEAPDPLVDTAVRG